ncbi:hypothetical protein GHT06_011330 [Daphnia sinensis]|uniref:Uncharacterized protein n=1 Tax=Daphnia sinensis TaxID=1820382 RepID=A0AAD5PZW3_9CRUS|nr:hypothetical protein GHT06_011330 [Daphnia sinensis]
MRGIAIILSASILAVFSSSPEHSQQTFQNLNSSPATRAKALFYIPHAFPETPLYHGIPLPNYYPFPYPYVHVAPKLILNEPDARIDVTNSGPTVPSHLIDQNISDEEAMRQLEVLKEIYTQNSENGIVLPSIVPASRGFVALKASALINFLNSFSLATATKTKTKLFIYPTLG